MDKDINRAIVAGRVGRDPEVRYTGNGKAVANFSVATSSGQGDKEYTEWHNVVSWGGLAEKAGNLQKGDRVWVEGRIQTRPWEDRDGNKRSTTEIVADGLTSDRFWKESGRDQRQTDPSPQPTKQKQTSWASDNYGPPPDDDIPF